MKQENSSFCLESGHNGKCYRKARDGAVTTYGQFYSLCEVRPEILGDVKECAEYIRRKWWDLTHTHCCCRRQ